MKNSITYIIIASIVVAVAGAVAFVSLSAPQTLHTIPPSFISTNITEQSPIENLKKFNSTDNLQNMFLNKDRLVIFYNDNTEHYSISQYDYIPNPVYTPVTHAVIIDIADKENPKILKNYEVTGYYTGARMIGNYVYFISNSYV